MLKKPLLLQLDIKIVIAININMMKVYFFSFALFI